ncbi:adenylate/guanylate cyclase domain-containing protein [Mycolicibacterium cyprinidarum]|uniref:Adenylate/guanylate cyclase domain-containing protein n=1 Tax=Mycolicibacterium cyprinidarum TaxID=2860311 RepID=A0ABQ4VBH2_9MYCO|nr:adenylate/guanylate cyclase domain-containing protein [Mycolicibacterium sp. NGTWS0302]GJF17882.1 adenylate/guanylate cyclase domain-containing protein [Mycolicibacterium sp. NGTWSNA01]
MRPRRLLIRYAAGLTSAHLLTVAEVVAIVVSLAGGSVVTSYNVIALVVVSIVGTAAVAAGAVLIVAPSLRWLSAGLTPTHAQLRTATNTMRNQAIVTLAPWVLMAAILVPLNLDAAPAVLIVIASAILFGAIATVSTGFLFTLRTLRPLLAAVPADIEHPIAPGVRRRLLLMWTLCTALPGSAIVLLLVMRSHGWLLDDSAPIELALLVLALVAVILGLRAMIVVSMSISDPVNQVVEAMAEVEKGHIDRTIDVYEWSEIGQLQRGFNRMVAGLRERDRLRDLFGRHVGEEVARRAVEQIESPSGDEREVAVLFIDLVDSTKLAAAHPPHAIARLLNEFFRIVVAAVDEQHGLINKFQGDAALAVFGAPLQIPDPASAALSTARALAVELRRLPVDFGIGISAGPVFAGNIGAENRYEYTVVGDAVNEAARLSDSAKEFDGRALCSGAVIARAESAERDCWAPRGQIALRGRASATDIYVPSSPGELSA